MNISSLHPFSVWSYFLEISRIPRPSKQEGKIIAYLKAFAGANHLPYKEDSAGNLLICKPATQGYEDRETVILQAHVDMVCEKEPGLDFDFSCDPLDIYIDDNYVRARGTTLGADNGIGVAAMLAILGDVSLPHGPLECLFTVDEEVGMSGASGIESSLLSGRYMLNLDGSGIGDIYIGSAGGMDTVVTIPAVKEAIPPGTFFFTIEINGLLGGHSGDDINKNRACAIKLLMQYLNTIVEQNIGLWLCCFEGGNKHNAIAREASALVGVPFKEKETVRILLNLFIADMEEQHILSDPNIRIDLNSSSRQPEGLNPDLSKRVINCLLHAPHGVETLDPVIDDLVESSTNLAKATLTDGQIVVETLQRSSDQEKLWDVAKKVANAFEPLNGSAEHKGEYPGWKPNDQSALLNIADKAFRSLYNKGVTPKAVHAGLECSLFLEKYPQLEIISFGPDMYDIHSPQERLYIPSVEVWWNHLTEMLKLVPNRKE